MLPLLLAFATGNAVGIAVGISVNMLLELLLVADTYHFCIAVELLLLCSFVAVALLLP